MTVVGRVTSFQHCPTSSGLLASIGVGGSFSKFIRPPQLGDQM